MSVFLNNSYIDSCIVSGNEVGKLAIIFTLINHSWFMVLNFSPRLCNRLSHFATPWNMRGSTEFASCQLFCSTLPSPVSYLPIFYLPSPIVSEAISRRCSVKNVFKNSQENTCARVPFSIKLLKKRRLWHRCFPVNFETFLRILFL